MKNTLANGLIALGVLLLIISSVLLWQRYNPNRLSFKNVDTSSSSDSNLFENNEPIAISIDELAINLPVIPAKYNEKKWETTTYGVSYLISSAIPGSVGNSIFYGHNYTNILGNLKKARPGQIIEIEFKDAKKKKFRIEYVQTVNPDQIGILDQTDDKRLTLYTCTGFLDSKRLVVTAFYQEDPGASI